jgi:hypothetical protein
MPDIDVSDDTYHALELLGAAWKISPADVVARLVNTLAPDAVVRRDSPSSPRDAAGEQVALRAGGNTHA